MTAGRRPSENGSGRRKTTVGQMEVHHRWHLKEGT